MDKAVDIASFQIFDYFVANSVPWQVEYNFFSQASNFIKIILNNITKII